MRYSNFAPDWHFHPTDKTADVAVVRVGEQKNAELLAVSIKDFIASADVSPRGDAFIGDEVFVTGLFTLASGVTRNLPIVRHGNIALGSRKNKFKPRLDFATPILWKVVQSVA